MIERARPLAGRSVSIARVRDRRSNNLRNTRNVETNL